MSVHPQIFCKRCINKYIITAVDRREISTENDMTSDILCIRNALTSCRLAISAFPLSRNDMVIHANMSRSIR